MASTNQFENYSQHLLIPLTAKDRKIRNSAAGGGSVIQKTI
jgi:hypothetical protein